MKKRLIKTVALMLICTLLFSQVDALSIFDNHNDVASVVQDSEKRSLDDSEEKDADDDDEDEDEDDDEEEDTRSEGEKDGEAAGSTDGFNAGVKDYFDGADNRYGKAMPTRKQIYKIYNLERFGTQYRVDFFNAYQTSFQLNYELAFNAENLKSVNGSAQRGAQHGSEFGKSEGARAATFDNLNNYHSDWLKAYQQFTEEQSLTERYHLKRHGEIYRDFFINGFKYNFKASYKEYFDNIAAELQMKNQVYHVVSYFEDTLIHQKGQMQIDGASAALKYNDTAHLFFEEGTVYRDTLLNISRIKNIAATESAYYENVSGVYQVSIFDPSNAIKLNKAVKLSFPFTSDSNIGIYKWESSRWIYLPTERDSESVYTMIPAGKYRGGSYAVFVDDTFKLPKDIVYNWAFQDIYLALRRLFLSQDDYFRPDEAMTRLEYAHTLYHYLHYRYDAPISAYRRIVDRDRFKTDERYVEFVLALGLMQLDHKGAFNPQASVSYDDVAASLQRVKTADISFSDIIDEMFYRDLHRARYRENSALSMTRAEVVYVLNRMLR